MSLILSGTDGLSDVDGSASTPAIRGTDANTGIFFPAADTIAFAEGGTEVARFNSSGNLQTLGTIGVGNATPSTSGAGITFPATQSASSNANTLDDYEEGTFTPTVAPSGGSLTSYTSSGTYTKIGNTVLIDVVFQITSTGTASGQATVSGIPFTSRFVSGTEFTCTSRENFNAGLWYVGFNGGGTTTVTLSTITGTAIDWTTNNRYTFSLTYQA